jgi:acetate kinase
MSLWLWQTAVMTVLTINAGSSSIRFGFFAAEQPARGLLTGNLERIGLSDTRLVVRGSGADAGAKAPAPVAVGVGAQDHTSAVDFLMQWLETHPLFPSVDAIGHRVVHGMHHTAPERVTTGLIGELRAITPFDPEHLPRELELIETLGRRFPRLPQVACFDTAFHRSMPRVATLLPIPRRFEALGVQRYGFHGLSYTYLMRELTRLTGPTAARGRVILAHLGNGASLAAVREGRCIDTSMGFTPASGLVMSTRSGDLDPGIGSYLAQSAGLQPAQFQTMVNHASGLLGVSETSSDVRDLLAAESTDVRAAEALELFCYQAKKWIGSYAAALGGLDTLVFAGGIGENAAPVRARILTGLEFLGIRLHDERNAQHAPVVSSDASAVTVRVIKTDEESVIADLTLELLGTATQG